MSNAIERDDIAARLVRKIDDAQRVSYVSPCPSDWTPVAARCHENAVAWVARHPGWSVVRGWLHVFGDADSGAMFDAHSVVRDDNGRIWDVTQDDCHSFIAYDGPEEQFLAAVRTGPWQDAQGTWASIEVHPGLDDWEVD